MKGKCKLCGKDDVVLVNNMCPDCLTLSMYIENELDDDETEVDSDEEADEEERDPANIPRVGQKDIDISDLAASVKLSTLAKRNEMLIKNAGITPQDRMIFKGDFNKLYNKYRSEIKADKYRIAKATFVSNVPNDAIIDASRGLVVVKSEALK